MSRQSKFTNRPTRGAPITPAQDGLVAEPWNSFFDSVFQRLNSLLGNGVPFNAYTVNELQTSVLASDNTNKGVIVTDETGSPSGYTIAISDGTDWRRVSDGAVISDM